MCKPVFDSSKILKENAMLLVRKELFDEWDFEKNVGIDIYEMTKSNGYTAFWKCELGHEFKSRVADRVNNNHNCPICSNHQLLVGFNDMNSTNINLANLLADPNDGYKYMQTSSSKVDWKCPYCGEIIKNKAIYHIKSKGLSCPRCSDGFSYPERFIYNVLKQLNVEFEWQRTFDWSNGKRYDFYLEFNSEKIIIEVHGKQHYEENFEYDNARTLREEQENDNLKKYLAIKNNVNHYFILDARESNPRFIKKSFLDSNFLKTVSIKHDIDWDDVFIKSEKSLVLTVNELWNSGIKIINEISSKLNISRDTVYEYLKRGKENNWNDYCPNEARLNGSQSVKKKIVRIDKFNNYTVYNSIVEASAENNNLDTSSITKVCKGKRKSSGGFIWLYFEDYEKYIKQQNKEITG